MLGREGWTEWWDVSDGPWLEINKLCLCCVSDSYWCAVVFGGSRGDEREIGLGMFGSMCIHCSHPCSLGWSRYYCFVIKNFVSGSICCPCSMSFIGTEQLKVHHRFIPWWILWLTNNNLFSFLYFSPWDDLLDSFSTPQCSVLVIAGIQGDYTYRQEIWFECFLLMCFFHTDDGENSSFPK